MVTDLARTKQRLVGGLEDSVVQYGFFPLKTRARPPLVLLRPKSGVRGVVAHGHVAVVEGGGKA
jgi:hypothetical protein